MSFYMKYKFDRHQHPIHMLLHDVEKPPHIVTDYVWTISSYDRFDMACLYKNLISQIDRKYYNDSNSDIFHANAYYMYCIYKFLQ
jgi:hypothetical protein